MKIKKREDYLGAINCETGISEFHFGLLYAVKTNAMRIIPANKKISAIDHGSISGLQEIVCRKAGKEFELWAKTAVEPLMKSFG